MSLKIHLDAYCRAFNERSLDGTIAQFADHALFELPLLGQRLFGRAEIAAGLRRIFEVTESARLTFSDVTASEPMLIAEGELQAKLHRDAAPVAMPAAVVLEAKDGKIVRLSTYLDARPYRLWSDGPIFATLQQ
jgi:ketosteroid isomerase-like protein